MAFDLNNFVIDRVVRGIAVSQGDNDKLRISAGDVLFSINQITNPSLSCSSESTDAVDALNVPIATFYRAKTAEFSAENALFDMNLLATQAGTTKKVASSTAKIETPCFQTIDVVAGTTKYDLSHTPKSTPKVYVLNGDGTLGDKITISSAPYNKEVAISNQDKKLTIGTSAKEYATATAYNVGDYVLYGTSDSDKKTYVCTTSISVSDNTAWKSDSWKEVTDKSNLFAAGDQIFLMYDYEADGADGNGAVEVANSATNFPVGCKFIMEILGADVCDQTNLIYAYLIFPNRLCA